MKHMDNSNNNIRLEIELTNRERRRFDNKR